MGGFYFIMHETNQEDTLMLKKLLGICALLPAVTFAADNEIKFLNFNSQAEFNEFAEDLTGGLAYKTLEPAEPLGLIGFDLGISYNMSTLKYKHMDKVSANPRDNLDAISLHAVKGLPLGIDFGLTYTTLPLSNLSTWSGKLSYALVEGGTLYPAIGISGNYTQTTGDQAVSFNSYGAELGISKGFANLTPFAAVGMINGEVTPEETNLGSASLSKKSVSMMKYAAGLNINLLIMDVMIAYNQIGEVPTYTLKAGYRF